jgi:glycerophosphoryl diester phosphodiesterase
MIILSHRGYWKSVDEKNTRVAFDRSFSLGFGTETDLRDSDGELVISHDPARQDALPAKAFFSAYRYHAQDLPLALNIKADGLQKLLKATLLEHEIQNYFVFDMSVPDMISYIKAGLRVFTRESEYEPNPVLYDQSQGVWVDGFNSEWVNEDAIEKHLIRGKQVCLVSPDLHGRPFEAFWEKLAKMPVTTSQDVMLCTDHPEQARKIFHE